MGSREKSTGQRFRRLKVIPNTTGQALSPEETRTTLGQLRSEIEALQGTEIDITPVLDMDALQRQLNDWLAGFYPAGGVV